MHWRCWDSVKMTPLEFYPLRVQCGGPPTLKGGFPRLEVKWLLSSCLFLLLLHGFPMYFSWVYLAPPTGPVTSSCDLVQTTIRTASEDKP